MLPRVQVGSVISSPSMSWIAEARLNRDIMGRSAPVMADRNNRSPTKAGQCEWRNLERSPNEATKSCSCLFVQERGGHLLAQSSGAI